jgi:hypothetical protein
LSCFLPLTAAAQEAPKVEASFGYSLLGIETENSVHGWSGSVFGSVGDSLQLGVDASGHYEDGGALHYVMGGPRYKFRGRRVEPYVHALFGVAIFEAEAARFSMGLGGGLDVKVSDSVAIRAVQVDYAPIISGGGSIDNMRISAGVVFRFGER